MFKKGKFLIILSSIVATLLLVVAIILSSVLIKNYKTKKNDEKAAATVIAHIEKLDNGTITLDSENLIMSVKTEYELLTDKQKTLVSNYVILDNAVNQLKKLKDKEVADKVINEIKRINKATLTADNTTVAAVLEEYEALTEEQKALVTNYNVLLEYKEIVDEKIAALEQKNLGLELAENFASFDGKWGDFGEHKNKYQGMIEAALHRDVNYKKYFSTSANSLNFTVSRFEKNTTIFGIGICYFEFSGVDKESGRRGTLYGEIVIKEDGSLVANENGYYVSNYY
jgi:putative component of toxin-antitoxin plasmid stabilization module